MSDIVERLRKVERVERELAHDWDMPPEGTANWEYAETCREAAARIQQLEAALRWFTDEYDKVQPMRQARMHAPECRCVLCAYDKARAALGEKP